MAGLGLGNPNLNLTNLWPKQGRRSSSMASELVAGTPAGGSTAPELPLPPALEAHVEAAYGVAPGGSRRMRTCH